jgi:xanthine dehydrogenase YagR molybdenum-binding subunit
MPPKSAKKTPKKAAKPTTTLNLGFAGHLGPVETELPEGEARPWDADSKLTVVGRKVPRIDGAAKVSGRAKYTYDVAVPGMLWAAVLRCPHPAAKVVSIDVSKALGQPGVKAAIGVAKVGDTLKFAGQDVAAIAADRPDQAHAALAFIEVEYARAKYTVDVVSAAHPKAPAVHAAGAIDERRTEGDVGDSSTGKAQGNVRALPPSTRGDVDKAMATAKFVHEATYVVPVQTHAALETHGLLVRWDAEDKMTVWCSTQGIFSVRDEMAATFGLDKDKVRVIAEFVGGGFGAKFGASAPGSGLGFIAGELSRKAKAPVKLMCTRHDEHVCTGNRPDAIQQVKLGAKGKDLVAIDVRSHGTAGVGTGAGVGRNAIGIYTKCPNVRVLSYDVFTNGGPGTAMRAPGHPQGAFAMELALDELAAKMKVDPLDLRVRHDEHPLRRQQLQIGRDKFDWTAKRAQSAQLRAAGARIRKGYGVATSLWGDFGRGLATVATVSVRPDASIEVRNGVQDIGGGIVTVLAQVAAEVFRRPLSTIVVKYGDSDFGPSVGSGGSQTTSSVTPAVRNAAEQAKTQLTKRAAELLGVADASEVIWDDEGTASAGGKSMTFAQVCKKIVGEAIVATASRPQTYGTSPMPFPGAPVSQIAGVQFAEVRVDTWTGVVTVPHVLALHDCGRVMNELTVRSQINGGVILGASYALMEQRVMDTDFGRMLNPNLESYKVLGAEDTPRIDIELQQVFTGANNTGAAGIGEPATIPTAAAIACAVFDAIGAPVRSLPLTPGRVLAALGAYEGAGDPPLPDYLRA